MSEASGRRSGTTLLLGLLLAGLGLWWLLALVADVELPARIVLPVLVIVAGIGVVLTRGGARALLVIVGIVLALAAIAAQAVEPHLLRGGIGDRNVAPTEVADSSYRLAIGQITVDLRSYHGDAVKASVAIGQVLVYTPPLRAVEVRAHAGVGEVDVFGITRSGVGADLDYTSTGVSPPLVLDVEAGVGQVRVVRG